MARRSWIKLHCGGEGGWFDGTVRWELTPVQRSIWVDLLALCGNSRYPDEGVIAAGKNADGTYIPFPEKYITTLVQVEPEFYRDTLALFVKHERIDIDPNGVIHIRNWTRYQSEYGRVVKYRKNRQDQNREDKIREDTEKVTPPSPSRGSAGSVFNAPPIESFMFNPDRNLDEVPVTRLMPVEESR